MSSLEVRLLRAAIERETTSLPMVRRRILGAADEQLATVGEVEAVNYLTGERFTELRILPGSGVVVRSTTEPLGSGTDLTGVPLREVEVLPGHALVVRASLPRPCPGAE